MESKRGRGQRAPSQAVIFDMDGVLLDSEPFWQVAESDVFASVGLDLTSEDMAQTIGLRIQEVVAFWYRHHPWEGPSLEEVASRVVARVIELIHQRGEMLPGVRRAIESIHALGVPMTVASSSSRALIEAVVERFDLGGFFPAVFSADAETHGKPHPAVFLTAAASLGVGPMDCLVIEDSLNGVLAAKAARMRCLVVPDPRQQGDPRFAIADRVLDSLDDLDEDFWGRWIGAGNSEY